MGDSRNAESGSLLPVRQLTVTVPNILDGDSADVDLPADPAFKDPSGAVAVPVSVVFKGAPLANLGLLGAWVKTITTGVITVRFCALTGAVATDDQDIVIQRVA